MHKVTQHLYAISAKNGEIATVSLSIILEDRDYSYKYISVLIQLFVLISVSVSFITIGSILYHTSIVDSYWDVTFTAETKYRGTARIASCRNTLLQQVREEVPSFDYYLVLDVDVGSSPSFDIKDFLSNFIYERFSWIAMTATQRTEYYDIWALRIKSILPFDCWQRIKELTSFFIDRTFLTKHLVKIHQEPIPRNISLIEVESAFGGAALYDAKYLNIACSYEGNNEHGWWWNNEQCEHVSFHLCIQRYANEKKIYINPRFQIC
ncbi:unnamed protein product [Rotaria sp. Silwood1]|nr:unnamed protein product [Rotaria sp. Silwood1]